MALLVDGHTVGVVVVSDRGDLYLPGCLENLQAVLPGVQPMIVDDHRHHLGMAGAVRAGMAMAFDAGVEYALWVEEDFRFNVVPPLDNMVAILERNPFCSQIVLKRQPWSVEEEQAGGFIEMHPEDYLDRSDECMHWLDHKRIFSLNPCLIPRQVLSIGYPDGNEAEQTERLLSYGRYFAIYGKREDPPLVHHLGHERGKGWKL
jgi:hypothetical protein